MVNNRRSRKLPKKNNWLRKLRHFNLLDWFSQMMSTSKGRTTLLVAGCVLLAIILIILFSVIFSRKTLDTKSMEKDDPAVLPSATVRPARTAAVVDDFQAQEVVYRYLGNGAQDFSFEEKQIDLPSISDKELAFSAGTGSVNAPVLTKLYYYNIDTGEETNLSTASIYMGEYYETQINHNWVVWLETDHGKNNIIYCMNRATSTITRIKNCVNGKPKLRLARDTLIWLEQEEASVDQLYMLDLPTQEDALLFTLEGATSYGVSAPYIYEDTIVWAGPQAEGEDENKSSIYYVPIGANTFNADGTMNYRTISPGTYVHEPKYNGEVFIWIDTNKSPNATLWLCDNKGGKPLAIDKGVTTYSIGDDIVVYGKNSGVWVYVISTGETCRLTNESEKGQQPFVNKRTVVWYNISAEGDNDVLRYKVLKDEDLYPGRQK